MNVMRRARASVPRAEPPSAVCIEYAAKRLTSGYLDHVRAPAVTHSLLLDISVVEQHLPATGSRPTLTTL